MEEKETKKKSTSTTKKSTSTKSNSRTSSNVKKSGTTTKKSTPKKSTAPKKTQEVKSEIKKEEIKEVKIEEPVVKQEEKKENTKSYEVDYFTIAVLVLAVILVFLATVKLFGQDKENYGESYLVKNKIVSSITCDDIARAIQGEKSYIFVTSVGSEEEYKLEKKMASIIQDKNLKNDFYVYILNDNCGPISNPQSVAGSKLKLSNGLDNIPTILYYRDGNLTEVVAREDKTMLQDGDFARIVDIYEE